MFEVGDICIVNEEAKKHLVGSYLTLVGKEVEIKSTDTVFDKYPIRVVRPDKAIPQQWSSQLRMRADLLTKVR